jgi:hypothetical protein
LKLIFHHTTKEKNMIIYEKSELEAAIKAGVQEITIQGDLAEKIHNGRKIRTIGKFTMIALASAIAAIPFTGGTSIAAFASVAALTGLEIALIVAVAFVGVALLTAIWKEYEEIEYSHNPLRLKLKRKG